MSSAWIAHRPRKPRARLRLFCLPYAGGGASIYQRWHESLTDAIDVCPVELPGRLSRLGEAPYCEMKSLVTALTGVLAPELDMPFACFGYSMGALIAYEWTRALARERGLEAKHLIVAARQPPDEPSRDHVCTGMSDGEFLERIKSLYGPRIDAVLCDAELRAVYLKMLRADFGVIDTYVHGTGHPLRTPITALGGEGDSSVVRESLARWQQHSCGRFGLHMVKGDHFFIHTDEGAVINTVKSALGLSTPH